MTKQEDDSAPRHLMELLGEPALLKTEDARLYWRLKREIELLIKPENILDEMRVMDITNSVWESQRFRRNLINIVDGERARALVHLVMPFLSLDHQKALGLAQYYYGSSSDRKKLA